MSLKRRVRDWAWDVLRAQGLALQSIGVLNGAPSRAEPWGAAQVAAALPKEIQQGLLWSLHNRGCAASFSAGLQTCLQLLQGQMAHELLLLLPQPRGPWGHEAFLGSLTNWRGDHECVRGHP